MRIEEIGIDNPNDKCVLILLEHIHFRNCREERIYKNLMSKYGKVYYDYRLENFLKHEGFLDYKSSDDPMVDDPELPPITNKAGQIAIKNGRFSSETGICYGNIWIYWFKRLNYKWILSIITAILLGGSVFYYITVNIVYNHSEISKSINVIDNNNE